MNNGGSMNFSNLQLNKIIQSMYLDVPPSELTLDWFKRKFDEVIPESEDLLNDPVRKQEYKILKAIIDSNELSVLQDKTQVINRIICGENVSTRLTHTFQVFWISYRIAEALGCDPLKAGIIALAHDLGHVAFGHSGEREIDRIIQLIKTKTSIIIINMRDYDHGFYSKIDKYKHEQFSVIQLKKILKNNGLEIDLKTKREIFNGILEHGGEFGKAITMEGKIVSVADKIYLNQDTLDMFMLLESIEQNMRRDIALGYRISTEVKNGADQISSILENIPKNLGDTPKERRDSMLCSLLLNSDREKFAFDKQTLNNISILKSYLYENLYGNKYMREIEKYMDIYIFTAYNNILMKAEEVREEFEHFLRFNGYYGRIGQDNADYNKLLLCFLNSWGESFGGRKRDIKNGQYLHEARLKYGDYLETDKVFNQIVNLTEKKVICSEPYILNMLRHYANENPLIDRYILEKNRIDDHFTNPDVFSREYFDQAVYDMPDRFTRKPITGNTTVRGF